MTSRLARVPTVHLLAPLHGELVAVLDDLSAGEWNAPTICGSWRVRDVAAHLLDTMLRRLSLGRDRATPPSAERPIESYDDLVQYLDQLNADWVRAAQRLSPRVMRELLAWAGPHVATYMSGLAPHAEAVFPVAWAGESRSENWMDVGREYTEQWLHQQHIRLAVDRPLLRERRWLHPVIALFVRALPRAYAGVVVPDGTVVVVEISGEAGGRWHLRREDAAWKLGAGDALEAAARVTLTDDNAWRLFSKSLRGRAPSDVVEVSGVPELGEPVLAARAIMG